MTAENPQTTLEEAIESLKKSLARGDGLMKSETWSGGGFKSCAVRKVLEFVSRIPLEPTPQMRDAGAQRLVSFEDNSVWPDSWDALQVASAKNEAERVWRSMWIAAMEGL
jgi:hypothetical protein